MLCCLWREKGAGTASLPTLGTDGLCLQMQRMPTISHFRWLTFGTTSTPAHTGWPKHPSQSWGQETSSLWAAGAAEGRIWSLVALVGLLVPGQRWACRRSRKQRQWWEVKEKKKMWKVPPWQNPKPFNKTRLSMHCQTFLLLKGYTCVGAFAFLFVPVVKVLLHLLC